MNSVFLERLLLLLVGAYMLLVMVAGISVELACYGSLEMWLLVNALFYFVPSFIALYRRTNNRFGIVALNLFLGWTVIGWLVAFMWATYAPSKNNF